MFFTKGNNSYTSIEECLVLDKRFYTAISVNSLERKVILPNTYLIVSETRTLDDKQSKGISGDAIKKQLSSITLKVEGRDIYDNLVTFERDLKWFARYANIQSD